MKNSKGTDKSTSRSKFVETIPTPIGGHVVISGETINEFIENRKACYAEVLGIDIADWTKSN